MMHRWRKVRFAEAPTLEEEEAAIEELTFASTKYSLEEDENAYWDGQDDAMGAPLKMDE